MWVYSMCPHVTMSCPVCFPLSFFLKCNSSLSLVLSPDWQTVMILPLLNGHAHLALCHSTLAREDTSLSLCELSLPSFAIASPRLGLLQNTEAHKLFTSLSCLLELSTCFSDCKVWLKITGNWPYMNHLSVVVWQILLKTEKSGNLVTSKYSLQW